MTRARLASLVWARIINSIPSSSWLWLALRTCEERDGAGRGPSIGAAGPPEREWTNGGAASTVRRRRAAHETIARWIDARAEANRAEAPPLKMDSDVYSNIKFLVIFFKLWINKI